MGEWSQTTCDACNYESFSQSGPGYFEGSAISATYEGWAILTKRRMTTPMTLSSGYVIEAYETTDKACICAECLKDRETVDSFCAWDATGIDAENYRKARDAFRAAEEAEMEREDAEYEAAAASRDSQETK